MDPNQPEQPNPQVQNPPPQQNPQTQVNQQTPPQASPGNKSGTNPPSQNEEHGTSTTRNVIAILLLIFVPIIGLFYVFLFTKWPKWAKIVLTLVFVLPFLLILISVVLIFMNPQRQFGQAQDTKRQSATTQLSNAIGAYYADNDGELPEGITTTNQEISSNGADLCEELVGTYIPSIPVDPDLDTADVTSCGGDYSTGYYVMLESTGEVTVSAPMTEGDVEISITR